ncbi:MAG: hypothetical protein IJ774_04090 [Selenomonadaceae bacterium]|nr:hypothetical protein [Selenomonadaceae bacterium]
MAGEIVELRGDVQLARRRKSDSTDSNGKPTVARYRIFVDSGRLIDTAEIVAVEKFSPETVTVKLPPALSTKKLLVAVTGSF